MKVILGISAFYHDSAACLIKDGKIIAAAQEERFTRIKHDSNYPYHSIEYVLNFSGYKSAKSFISLSFRSLVCNAATPFTE